ncbi:FAD-dependent oxidoreductase [Desulfurococcaceae archaeon MEX13E-LK6-19]|nr:FAD-dependent oxidoreductase [Desulfurococcaceae archaeon MEX13E-LK6-19]
MSTRDYRIYDHPIIDFRRGRKITFYFEDKVIEAYEGESILAALYAVGIRIFSWSPKLSRPRGAFCMIGKCSSCLATVDGIPNKRICIEPVREGIRVYRQKGLPETPNVKQIEELDTVEVETDLLVIGGGPAGLQAALTASKLGLNVVIVNDHYKLGGQLVKQTHRFFGARQFNGGMRGFKIAEMLEEKIRKQNNIKVYTQALAYGYFKGGIVGVAVRGPKPVNLLVKPKAIVAATGASEKGLTFENNDLPGVMGAGGAQTLMNEYGVLPGEKALIIGSGNVGLIIAYQLMQAGAKVQAIAEILPKIGGWFVHAAKIRRYGVKILTRHTITKAIGETHVEKAVLQMVDENFRPVPGTEKEFDVDLVLLSVGLTPDTRFFSQAGAVMKWIPELGGLTPIRTRYLETSVEGLYIAGDAAGIEEATTAFIEGEIAGLSAAIKLGVDKKEAYERREKLLDYLWNEYRMSPVVERSRIGKLKATVSEEEMEKIRRGL